MKGFEVIEPLSNFQIIEKCRELNLKHFKGVFMRDELLNSKLTKTECLILNIDHSSNVGTHWTCLFTDEGISYYFDSFGFRPPKEIEKYCNTEERYFNTFRIQKPEEVICGHYCIYMLYKLSNGYKFYDILNELFRYKKL
jgi:hypothetical protein